MLGYRQSALVTPLDFGAQDIARCHRLTLDTYQGQHVHARKPDVGLALFVRVVRLELVVIPVLAAWLVLLARLRCRHRLD